MRLRCRASSLFLETWTQETLADHQLPGCGWYWTSRRSAQRCPYQLPQKQLGRLARYAAPVEDEQQHQVGLSIVAKQCRVANVWIHQLKILFVHRTYSEIKIYMYKSQLYTIYSTVYQYMYRSRLHNTIGLNRKAQLKCTTIHTNNSSIISSRQRYRYNQRKLCWQRSSSFM